MRFAISHRESAAGASRRKREKAVSCRSRSSESGPIGRMSAPRGASKTVREPRYHGWALDGALKERPLLRQSGWYRGWIQASYRPRGLDMAFKLRGFFM